ncbi:MAG TPA: UvrD-helicase domain-containing protein [Geobacteraceae bacterium]
MPGSAMEWSAAKQEVFAFAGDIVVSAGAGSGKTAALVELYLRLLAGETRFPRPLAVEEIVAITFTDKAAVEMKERVRQGMAARLARGDGSAPWEKCLRQLPAAPIATFHSFCSRVLRENPAEAGVDPSFTLMDELTAGGELQAALDEVIEGELKARSPEIRLLLAQYPLSGAGRGRGLREHLVGLRRKRSASGMDDDALRRLAEQWDREAAGLFRTHLRELDGLVGEAQRVLAGKELAFHLKLRDLPELYHRAPLSLEDGETARRLAAMAGCIGGNWGKEKPLRESLSACIETLGLAWWQKESAPCGSALLVLSGKVETAYRRRKEERGGLDFDDLQGKVRDLLRNDAVLREECRGRFPVIMVDEFQDTNPLQKDLLGLLCGEGQRLFIVGDPKQSIYLFRGADVSVFGQAQAETAARGGRNLYFRESFRSREGVIDFVNGLFRGVMGAGGAGFEVAYGPEDHLEPKRRDGDGGAPCVELLALEGEGTGAEKRSAEARAVAAKILRLVSGEDGVRVYDRRTGIGDENLEPRTSNIEPVFVPRKPRFGDIALLFRRFTHLKVFERELRRHAIPYYVVKGKGFYRCQEVLDILNFLGYLEFGGDLVSLAGLLRSPLCGVSDETLYLLSRLDGGIGAWESFSTRNSKLETRNSLWDRIDSADRGKLGSLARLMARLRPLRDRLTLAELLEEILTGTDFASSLLTTFQGEQKVANVRKLIELSRSVGGDGAGGLRGFVNYLRGLVESEPTEAEALVSAEGEDVVRLMTVHQSKGLEFPVVFLPELGAGHPADHGPVQYDDACGIGMKLAAPDGGWEQTLASRAITRLGSRKEGAELKRLFYVATTRARDYLILSGEKGRSGGAWREWVDGFLAGEGSSLVRVTHADTLEMRHAQCGMPHAEEKGGYPPVAVAEGVRRSLHYAPPLPSSMVFSPTALEDYAQCPRKYFYKAVMGLDEGLFAELLGRGPGRENAPRQGLTPLEKGDLAHLLLEKLDFAAGSAAQRAACARIAAARALDPGEAGVAEVIGNVLAFAASPLGRELAGKQAMREHPFTMGLTGIGKAPSYYIKGAMDLVVVDGESATVCDYKYLEKGSAELEGYRFQLRTYMLALARRWPDRRIGGKLLFLRGGEEETVTCDAPAFEAELLRIMDAVRIRRGEDEFALRDGCDGGDCPFRQRCVTSSSSPG